MTNDNNHTTKPIKKYKNLTPLATAELSTAERTLKRKRYRTILADPPWDINQKGKYGAVKHYNLIS
jgi:hypothetical protein